MSPRPEKPPYCEWPRSTCHEPPTRREKNGADFCEEHFKAWAQVMRDMMSDAATAARVLIRGGVWTPPSGGGT
jgi:hypothetical protein